MVFRLDLDAFLGLNRLVQTVRPAPAIHHAAGKFVNDHDLVVLDDVVIVAAEHVHRLHRLIEVVDDLRVFDIVEIVGFEQALLGEHLLNPVEAFLGELDVLGLLVLLVPLFGHFLGNFVELHIKVGLVLGWAGDDQRGSRFVDQDRVHFVNDRVVEGALHHLVALMLHVVAQIVEAEFVVGAVGDVGVVGVPL